MTIIASKSNRKFSYRIKAGDLIFFVVFLGLIFQAFIQMYIDIFKYFDEMITIASLLIVVLYTIKAKFINRRFVSILLIVIIYSIYGIICNLICGIASTEAILMDLGNQFKLFVCFLGFFIFFDGNRKCLVYHDYYLCRKVFQIFILLAVVFYPIMLVTKTPLMIYDYRNGIPSYCFVLGHAGTLYTICLMILCFFQVDSAKKYRIFPKKMYIFFTLLLMLVTLRSRAFACVFLFLILKFYFHTKGGVFRTFILIFASIIGLFIVGRESFELYFVSTTSARSTLFRYGLVSFFNRFPFGYGFGTYGSYAASNYYSSLYYQYGFNNVYGLSYEFRSFLTDNYWPMIFAQFGFVGTLLTISLLFLVFSYFVKKTKNNPALNVSVYTLIGFMFVNSTASSSFVHYSAIAQIFLLFCVVNIASLKGLKKSHDRN